jgi:hypothetical protein
MLTDNGVAVAAGQYVSLSDITWRQAQVYSGSECQRQEPRQRLAFQVDDNSGMQTAA